MLHRATFRQVLPNQTVRVLVGSAFPGMIGRGEVEGDTGGAFDFVIAVELGAVVDGDGLEEASLLANELNDPAVQLGLGVIRELRDQQAPGRTLDEGHDAMFGACSADGVHLPMADLTPELDRCRSFGDVPLSSQAATLLVRAVTLAILRSLPETTPQIPSRAFVAPDVLIDGLVADP